MYVLHTKPTRGKDLAKQGDLPELTLVSKRGNITPRPLHILVHFLPYSLDLLLFVIGHVQ
jgi:hypothetical protein